MTTKTFTASTELMTICCGGCGGVYAIGERFRSVCHQEGKSWTCPYCQTWWGWANGRGENARLKSELEEEKRAKASLGGQLTRSREETQHEANRANGYKGAMVRVKKRVAAGVCPNCNRTFKDLARHMKSKHTQ